MLTVKTPLALGDCGCSLEEGDEGRPLFVPGPCHKLPAERFDCGCSFGEDGWDPCSLHASAYSMLEVMRALVSSPAMVDNDEPLMAQARAIVNALAGH